MPMPCTFWLVSPNDLHLGQSNMLDKMVQY